MLVTITVNLDDEQEITRFAEVDSADNTSFWSHGVRIGTNKALDAIIRMMEAEYGEAPNDGIHLA
jgi:hypothetical protein